MGCQLRDDRPTIAPRCLSITARGSRSRTPSTIRCRSHAVRRASSTRLDDLPLRRIGSATQQAERRAKLHTIMQVLGHSGASMSMVYARISDREVLRDYQAVLGPGAVLAGPSAEILRSGGLSPEAVDWLKPNFFKTELELGHCLRLPQEGPCECDLYLNCAKFVTTRDYPPFACATRA